MSWLLIAIIVILLLSVIQGFRKGLVRTIVSTFFLIFVMAISIWITPYIQEFLESHTQVPEYVRESCETFLSDQMGGVTGTPTEEGEDSFQEKIIKELPIPAFLKEKLETNNTEEKYQQLAADNFGEYLAGYLSEIILYLLSFLIAFVVAVILIEVTLKLVDIMTELPLLGIANRVGGAAAGLVRALLWVWVFFAILTLFGNTEFGSACVIEIGKNPALNFLYTNNLLLSLLLKS